MNYHIIYRSYWAPVHSHCSEILIKRVLKTAVFKYLVPANLSGELGNEDLTYLSHASNLALPPHKYRCLMIVLRILDRYSSQKKEFFMQHLNSI